MRTLASLERYVLISSADEIRLHQYISGRYSGSVGESETTLEVETDYPWNGRVRVLMVSVPGGPELGITGAALGRRSRRTSER